METIKTLNEFLLRCNDDGTLRGAHAVYLYRTFDGEKMVSAATGNPVPLSKVDGPDLAKIASVIGEATTAALQAKEAAEATIAEKEAVITAKATELAGKESELNQAVTAKDEAEKRAAEYASELAAKMLAEHAPPAEPEA